MVLLKTIHHIFVIQFIILYQHMLLLDCMHTKAIIIKYLMWLVAVNHGVVQRLEEILVIELLELKCNIHPLYDIAKKSSNTLHIMMKIIK